MIVRLLVGLLLAAAVFACKSRGNADEPIAAHSTASRIRFVDPWFQLAPGKKTASISISIDGRSVGRCSMRDPKQEAICTEAIVEPGSHAIRLVMDYLDEETLRTLHQDYFHAETKIVVAAAEDIDFVLSGMEAEDERSYVRRRSVRRAMPRCLDRLFEAASAPTCSASELETARGLVSKAAQACASIDKRHAWQAESALGDVERNLLQLDLDRCLTEPERRRVPTIISAEQAHWSWWPKGTVEVGSWRWSRSVLPERSEWEQRHAPVPTLRERLRALERHLPTMIERVRMLDELLDDAMTGSPPSVAIDRALESRYDLDPRTVEGHRLHLLMVMGQDRDRAHDPRLAAFVGAHLRADERAHCADTSVARAVAYLLQDGHLSLEEWQAVQAVVGRTPADAAIDDACRRTLDAKLRSDVPILERLRWFTAFDCSPRRHTALRAKAVRRWVAHRSSSIDAEIRARVQDEFIACLGPDGG
jgi:hypothetical protein